MAKSKFTPEITKTIVDAIRLGETYRGAAMAAGISEETFHAWRREHPAFSEALVRAESELRRVNLARIERAAAGGNPNMATWILERRFPSEFGRQTLEISGPEGNPIPIATKPEDYPFLAEGKARDHASKLIHALATPARARPVAKPATNGTRPARRGGSH